MSNRTQMLNQLREMLRDVFRLRTEGGPHARLARAHGYIDGYMRVLVDSGVATKRELLVLVAEERATVDGPATTILSEPDALDTRAA